MLAVLTFVLLSILKPFPGHPYLIPSSALVLGTMSAIDDRRPLPPAVRLLVHLGLCIALVLGGVRIGAITNPLPGSFLGPDTSIHLESGAFLFASGVFTVAWLLLTINALNWFDGIPGQVSMLSTIGFLVIGALSMSDRVQQPLVAEAAFALAGIAAACALFDVPPPRVVLGDSGAMFFGLMLGILTIVSGGKVATAFLVMGVPLVDAAFVIIRRLVRGEPLTHGNRTDQHLHHRLLGCGMKERTIVLATACIGGAFGVTALFLSTGGKALAALFLIGLLIVISGLTDRRRRCHLLITTVPTAHADAVRKALSNAGAGQLNNYDGCSFTVQGTGRFRPLHGAQPTIGSIGTLETVEEERIEVLIPKTVTVASVLRALKAAHPYETPAVYIVALTHP
jgi:UDP-N-acetylmuramyl pentapeptide phosphotransferase/UDP-N-acetylglucosamine-1-phosphate transferase